ncbi:hypothetical protein CASFOL_030763 [Castilleja foliolosa]|uniref:Uncharacterized protein n=1 Tax=Castilleja foliolosa TaxID=1961234 RepID=A0ABD3C7A2_9LAMI
MTSHFPQRTGKRARVVVEDNSQRKNAGKGAIRRRFRNTKYEFFTCLIRTLAMEVYVSNITSVIREPLSAPATQIQNCRLVWARAVKEGEAAIRRRRALNRVDRELEKGNYKAAVSLVKQLKAHPAGILRGFGAASPKVGRNSELKLTGEVEISSVQLVVDAIIRSIKFSLEFQMKEEEEDEETEVSAQDFGNEMDVGSYDSIHEDHLMCIQHEAGHFLVGYMVGVLPRRYIVPSLEDLLQDRFARGKVEFLGFERLRDVGADTMSNKNFSIETLQKFSSVILGGMAAEHLVFGHSELLHSDVQKVSSWSQFSSGWASQRRKLIPRLGVLQRLLS